MRVMRMVFGLILPFLICIAHSLDFSDIANNRELTCDVGADPTRNHVASPVCTCKRNVKGELCSHCRKNSFDLRHDHPDGCLRCFCSGRGKDCVSAQLNQTQIQLMEDDFELSLLPRANASDIDDPTYWRMALNKNILDPTSYGGIFAFHYGYHKWYRLGTHWKKEPVVIIKGNGVELFLKPPLKRLKHDSGWFIVNLWEQYWMVDKKSKCKMVQKGTCKCPCCTKPKRKRAKRKHLMQALLNVEEIYIKALSDNYWRIQRPDEFWITKGSSALDAPSMSQVEKCDCLPGYEGLSCQMCAKGYKKIPHSRHWSGFKCVPCECNGNSDVCDPETGHCLMCQNDSEGDFCEKKVLRCNKAGTISDNGVLVKTEERCLCKSRVRGVLCDKCRRGSFDLSEENQHGCTKCWCSEVTHQCISSNLTRQTFPVYASFMNLQDVQSFERAIATSEGKAVYRVSNGIGALRWLLPKRATGNLLQSYGGSLKFIIENIGYCPITRFEPFVKLESHSGKSINWIFEPEINLNVTQTYTITLTEGNFQYLSLAISRNFFLEILSSVKNIYIYTPRCSEMISIGISGISLDSAVDFGSGGLPATDVEQCQCPHGYNGLSCENCDRGFFRDASHRCVKDVR